MRSTFMRIASIFLVLIVSRVPGQTRSYVPGGDRNYNTGGPGPNPAIQSIKKTQFNPAIHIGGQSIPSITIGNDLRILVV